MQSKQLPEISEKQAKINKKRGRRYSITQKLIIYAEKGGSLSAEKIGKKYQVDRTTVENIWKDEGLALMKDEVRITKECMSDELALTAGLCIKQVGVRIESASAKDAAISAGIMIDKMRLLDNKSTSNVGINTFLGMINDVPVTEGL